MRAITLPFLILGTIVGYATPSLASNFFFSTGDADGKVGTATRPSSVGKEEIETGDDFILNKKTSINKVSITGLLTGGIDINDVTSIRLEVYRVFPKDSDLNRTIQVPTRENSPSDVAFAEREASDLNFTSTILNSAFTVQNTIVDDISVGTGGEGSATGTQVRFDIDLDLPFTLDADHYFFVPQVEVNGGEFLWLSAAKPILPPGTSFDPDLQTWIRDEALQPDWLRVGTDVIGSGTFNAAFLLQGATVPEPSTFSPLGGIVLIGAGLWLRRRKAKS